MRRSGSPFACSTELPTYSIASRLPCVFRAVAVVACVAIVSCEGGDPGDHSSTRPAQQQAEQASGPRLHLPAIEPVVRVRLEAVRGRGEQIHVGQNGAQIHIHVGGEQWDPVDGPVRVERSDGHWVVRHGNDETRSHESNTALVISASVPLVVGSSKSDAHRFNGDLHCMPNEDDSGHGWNLIEHVSMEDYIPGVLMGELYAGWTFSCFAAQAVAARSFACMEVQMRSHRDWDVVASPSSQAYIGVTDDRTAHEAQEMTRGMVLAWGDQLVPGYFSSCCGGLAATAIGRISTSAVNDVPPLMGHDGRDYCTNSPLYDWTIDRSARTLHRRVNAWADHTGHRALGSLTSLKSITVHESNRHGRPTILRITDRSNRTADVDLQDFLSAANFDGSGSPPMRSKPLWSGWSEGSVDRGRVTLSGHGFGHGVGLCQYGAQELGSRGKSFREILSWYYPGAMIHAAW